VIETKDIFVSVHFTAGAWLLDANHIFVFIIYSKGNHDGAIQQYVRTIGHLEPSYVIRKVSITLNYDRPVRVFPC